MIKLGKNYWRTSWVLFTNGLLLFWLLIAPIRAHHNQQLLHQIMGTVPPVFSYWRALFSDLTTPITAAILAVGILLELRRNAFSPLVVLCPYALWLISLLKARMQYGNDAEVALSVRIFLIPLSIVVVVDCIFYLSALWRLRPARGLPPSGEPPPA